MPRWATFDCYGTLTRFRMGDIAREMFADRIPAEGAAVLVCNHVSYVDAIVIGAASPRPIRFVMDHRIFKLPLLGWIFRTARAIPIAPAKEDPWLMEKAYIDIAQALHEEVSLRPLLELAQGSLRVVAERRPRRIEEAGAFRSPDLPRAARHR